MTVIASKGQIVLPADLRQRDDILPGQRFDIERLGSGRYLLRKQSGKNCIGILNWLLACPAKGWLEPIPSESTESL